MSTYQRERWLGEIFTSQAARTGGVVRRAARDVDRRIGRQLFELEVRRRGFHLLECGGQYVVICTPGDLRIVC
ncbi:N-(5'-phosphoribosyl)anthranilate isomerase [Frigidibacter sp. SD6-1]|uniref:N-(5'-phosphoribosyl)anthranilate isomerase n=1 Tax=Frigidibacter sp. SD6-1 TaxID=3032581 RepID=UPI0024DF335A|nr:N-(5'-phosphoribosyl)anthranilate isomerase [Frigidibacter sp. SD6-1]